MTVSRPLHRRLLNEPKWKSPGLCNEPQVTRDSPVLAQQDLKAHDLCRRPDQHGIVSQTLCFTLQSKQLPGTAVIEGIHRSNKPPGVHSSGFWGDISLLGITRPPNFRYPLRDSKRGMNFLHLCPMFILFTACWPVLEQTK